MCGALIVAEFGTLASPDGAALVARAMEAAFPDRRVCRAVLSAPLRARLAERGERVEGVAEAVARLRGVDDVAVSAALVVGGREYDRLRREADGLRVAEPLLAGEADLRWMAGLLARIAREEGRPLLVMGHGADGADAAYARLSAMLPEEARLVCAEGARALDASLDGWPPAGTRSIALAPLLLSAGWHARRQMAAGSPGSWQERLEARGFDVRVRMRGLGELAEVRERFVEKARAVLGE